MNKKILLTSIIGLSFAMPAMAVDYTENNTYANSCTVDNLYVSSGNTDIATAIFEPDAYQCSSGTYLAANSAVCTTCPAGSFCPGGSYEFNENSAAGISTCPEGFTSSDSGVYADTQCYTPCTTSMFAHSTAVTGRDYYGAGTDTCQITSCETGYSVDSNATSCIANTLTVRWGDKDGNVHATTSCTYGGTLTTPAEAPTAPTGYHFVGWKFPYSYTPLIVTKPDYNGCKAGNGDSVGNCSGYYNNGLANGEWRLVWNNKGTATGTSLCTGTAGSSMGATSDAFTGNETGSYCWCKMTGFTESDGTTHDQSSSWVYTSNRGDKCARDCAGECASYLFNYSDFRSALFGSVQ